MHLQNSHTLTRKSTNWAKQRPQLYCTDHHNDLHVSISISACLVKISADDILKYYFGFLQKTGFDISCKLQTICMKRQSLLSGKNIKKNINSSSVELA